MNNIKRDEYQINSQKIYEPKDALSSKLILTGTLINTSPLVIGSGKSDKANLEIVKLSDGTAYLPGSSIAGKLKNYFKPIEKDIQKEYIYFWGGSIVVENGKGKEKEKHYQSHICIDDSFPKNNKSAISIKDGVKINTKTNTAETGAKYDYEALEPGVQFPFSAEVTIRQSFDKQAMQGLADFIGTIFQTDFRLGAFTQAGFGKMQCEDFEIRVFDFKDGDDGWFKYLEGDTDQGSILNYKKEDKIRLNKTGTLNLKAAFSIKKALITSTYGIGSKQPDKTQAYRKNNKDELVVSGKSIRGALRHRALKILQTVAEESKASKAVNDLFGIVEETKDGLVKKSRIRIDEAVLKNTKIHTQSRIKMDRFTGGTIDGALMESAAAWSQGTPNMSLNLQIKDFKTHELPLILLLLKDLWTGDLAIGGEKNIGRGVLQGINARLDLHGETALEIHEDETGLQLDAKENLPKEYNILNPENIHP